MIDTKSLLAEVKANIAALDACAGPHDFSIDTTPERPLAKTWKCTICGGTVGAIDRRWYQRGLAHGAKR